MLRIVISLLSFIVFSVSLFAQTDTVDLSGVEISAARTPVLYSSEVRPITILTKHQISALPLRDLDDVFRIQAGFDIRQRGVIGVQADLAMRGGSFEQTLILLNGICINDPQTGHHSLDIPVDIEHIERIEILRGPGTCLYGTNAFAGAINIITTGSDKDNLKISASGGDFGLFKGAVSGGFRTGKIHHYISLGGKACNGYMKNTDFGIGHAFYHGSSNIKNVNLQWQAGYVEKAFGANSFYTAKYPDQYEQTKTEFVSIHASIGKKWRVLPSVYWRRHHDRFDLFREKAPAWYTSPNYHLTDVVGSSLNLSIDHRFGRTYAGAEFRYEHIYSNVLGIAISPGVEVPGEYSALFNRMAERELISAFAGHQYSKNNISAEAGLLIHYSSAYGAGIFPGLDAGYKFTRNLQLYVSVNRALRLPTFTDLYYKGPVNIGNPLLKPETSWNFESGLKWNNKSINATVSGFFRMGYRMIDWVKRPDETVWHSDNITRLNTGGLEFDASLNLAKLIKRKCFIQMVNLSYTWIGMYKPSVDYISYYVLDYLKNKAVLSLEHRIWKNFGASWCLNFQDRAGTYTDPVTSAEMAYKPFLVLDGKLYWDISKLCLYLSINNITGAKYRDFAAIPMPGRWLICGLRVEID